MNISEEIDKSFGDGPTHRSVDEQVGAGRRLIVRRRIGVGSGAAATALVIGGAAWVLTPESLHSTEPAPHEVATQPTKQTRDRGADTRLADRKAKDPQSYLTKNELATYTPDGELIIATGVPDH